MRANIFGIVFLVFISFAQANEAINDTTIFKPRFDDLTYGKEEAPIQVVEYFALTCPHCSYFYLNSFPQIKVKYIDSGKVRWIKRSLISDGPSLKGTMLLNCVPKNRYESYLRILLNKQSNWAYQEDFLKTLNNIALLGGMSQDAFDQCINNKTKEKSIINLNHNDKKILNIKGTPSFFVNGKHLEIFSLNGFEEHFEELLKAKY
jgi:protein-disulfide isomerase